MLSQALHAKIMMLACSLSGGCGGFLPRAAVVRASWLHMLLLQKDVGLMLQVLSCLLPPGAVHLDTRCCTQQL